MSSRFSHQKWSGKGLWFNSSRQLSLTQLFTHSNGVCKQTKTRNSFTASHRQAGVQPPPGQQGSFTCNGYLGRQMPSLQTSPLLPPALYTEHDAIWCGISRWSVGVSCPGCVPSQFLVHPAEHGELKSP